MLNPEFKAKWLDALRSGKFKQARRQLRKRNGAMCCLGVACDLLGEKWEWDKRLPGYRAAAGGDGFYPPARVLEAAGLSYHDANKLSALNDFGTTHEEAPDDTRKPLSFAQIADFIEANL